MAEKLKSRVDDRLIKIDKVVTSRIQGPSDAWEKYICPKCSYLLDDAVQIACGHRLCRNCAIEMFDECPNPTCLVQEDGEQHSMIPDDIEDKTQKFFPDKFAQRDILKLKVTCQFPGCQEIITMKNLKDHVAQCEYAGELCIYCKEFIPANEFQDHQFKCPNMEKACPLSDMLWRDDLDEMLNETLKSSLKIKWNNALAKCKGHKFPMTEYQKHVNHHEDHLKTMAEVVNILMTLNAHMYKEQSSQRPTTGSDVERDGKPLFVKSNIPLDDEFETDNTGSYSRQLEKQKILLQTLQNTVDSVRKDFLQSSNELIMTRNELSIATGQIKDLTDKVNFFEQKLSTREQQLEEKDFRISLLEAANYDGTMIWRISGFDSRTKDARDARYTSIFSLPFYTGKYGYKMCLRLYPLGDGMGKNTHLSLFFVVMKSEYDSLLQWPFTNKVTLTLINQSGGPDVTDTFKPDPKSSSFQRPKTEMNVASGCPRFVPLDDLHRNGFIKDDTIFIKVKVETISARY